MAEGVGDKKSLKDLVALLHEKQLEVVAKYDLMETPTTSSDDFLLVNVGMADSFASSYSKRHSRASSVDSGYNDCMTESYTSQLATMSETTESSTDDFEKLRCPSRSIEDVNRRKRRTAELQLFPGLCLAQSLFQTGSIMKFHIIGNELSNIRRVHCRQVRSNIF